MNVKELSSHPRAYAFGPYLLDLKRHMLWRDDTPIPLKSRTLDVLAVLVENHGRVLEKDEFLKLVWRDAIVQESNLAQQISVLRRALGQRPDQHDYIVTNPGRGYQFVADVREVPCPEPLSVPTAATVPTGPDVDADDVPGDILPTGQPRSLIWMGAIALAVVSIVVAAVIVYGPSGPASSAQRGLSQFTFDPGLPREPTWSPDGQYLAYTSDRAGNPDIWIQAITNPEPIRLTSSSSPDWQPDWSPDGKWLAFRSERDGGGLYVVASTGGDPRRIADFGSRPRWSPDGSLILFSNLTVRAGTRGLFVVAAMGGDPKAVRNDLVEEFTGSSAFSSITAAWYPTGRRISIWGRHPKNGWTLLTASIDGGPAVASAISDPVREQLLSRLSLGSFVWARSGRLLYFEGRSDQARNLWRVTVEPSTMAWIGRPERLTTGAGDDTDIAISPDGTKLAFASRFARTRLWSLPFDTSAGTLTGPGAAITSGGPDELDGDAPADGNKLVYRVVRAGRQELRARSIVSGQDHLLISGSEVNRSAPRWSQDGTLLAYQVSRRRSDTGKSEHAVALLSADGGPERLITRPGDTDMVPMDWSRDGSVLLGTCHYGEPKLTGTCLLPLSNQGGDGQIQLITRDPAFNLFCQRFSPNQRWISFLALGAKDPASSRIFVVPAAGSGWVALTDGPWYVDKPRWAPDGRTLYYLSDRDGFLNVWGRGFDPASGQPIGEPFRLTAFGSEQRAIPARFGQMEMAVTSNHLFLPLEEKSGDIWVLDHIDK